MCVHLVDIPHSLATQSSSPDHFATRQCQSLLCAIYSIKHSIATAANSTQYIHYMYSHHARTIAFRTLVVVHIQYFFMLFNDHSSHTLLDILYNVSSLRLRGVFSRQIRKCGWTITGHKHTKKTPTELHSWSMNVRGCLIGPSRRSNSSSSIQIASIDYTRCARSANLIWRFVFPTDCLYTNTTI